MVGRHKKMVTRKRKGAISHEDTLMVHLFQWFRALQVTRHVCCKHYFTGGGK